MMRGTRPFIAGLLALIAAGALAGGGNDAAVKSAEEIMRKSFVDATPEEWKARLAQDQTQAACSYYRNEPPPDMAVRIVSEAQASIRYPADGKLLGDWKSGEKIAQTGVGLQYSDNPKQPAGGNCYACHELTKQEVSFGTIGPSLYRFGKTRGFTPEMEKYAYSKVYDADAFSACSNMPRFGYKHILTEQQIKDVTALLMDPASPVNQ